MKVCALTDIGRVRQVNQDYVFASTEAVGALPNLFLVADGMGGHKAGDYASRYLAEHMVDGIKNSEPGPAIRILRDNLIRVNRELFELSQSEPDLQGMGTTVVAATVLDGILHVANVGDSRLYRITHSGIRQITRDHSYVEEMVSMGQMNRESEEYRSHKNIITRAMGTARTVEADFFEEPLEKGDIILLCSDGLTNMVEDSSIHRVIQLPGTLQMKARGLIALANKSGGKDNIAVVLVEPQISEVVQ